MEEIIQEEWEEFLFEFSDATMFYRGFDVDDYEEEYSHQEIRKGQNAFMEKAKTFLHEKYPGKFVLMYSAQGCVLVMKISEAEKKIKHYERYIIK